MDMTDEEKAERLERQKKELEAAKTENLTSQKNAGDLYAEAIRAFARYSGNEDEDDDDDEEY